MLIVVDTARNVLEFELAPDARAGKWRQAEADLDIGERGRLLGLDLHLSESAQPVSSIVVDDRPDPYARTARVTVECGFAADGSLVRVILPRRGPGYEISYPSGNECWIDVSGVQHCAITRSG